MCLLALYFRSVGDAPVVAGANREEFYARGGDPPRLLDVRPRVVAGLDPAAGGTWLGVNEHGVLVALTNRRKSVAPERARSRGLLVRDLLRGGNAREAGEQAVRELGGGAYAGCNVLCADTRNAVLVQAGDWLRVRPLPPGLHVLANGDVNDEADRRVAYAQGRLGGRRFDRAADCLTALADLCSQTDPPEAPVCFRLADRGTVSGTLVALRETVYRGTYLHAQGPPDRTPYEDYSGLLRQMKGIADP